MQSIADERDDVKALGTRKIGLDRLFGWDFNAGRCSGDLAFAEAEGGASQAGEGTLVDGLDRQIGIGEDGDDHSGDFRMVVADLVQNLYRRYPAFAHR